LGILLFFILVVLRQRSTKFKFIISELRYVSQLSDVASVGIPLQACLQILLLSLTGVPPTLGFFAKFFVLANCMST
jgi:NADH:ubiquinone oxidoreductase subunit 2 (subunit N)